MLCVYILSYSGKVKLYWNQILRAWVDSKGNASPFHQNELPTWIKDISARTENVI